MDGYTMPVPHSMVAIAVISMHKMFNQFVLPVRADSDTINIKKCIRIGIGKGSERAESTFVSDIIIKIQFNTRTYF